MTEKFLYEELDTLAQWGALPKELPHPLRDALNPRYELRPYQVDAFARFIYCYHTNFPQKKKPLHLLFNMATGSGKTLIMAGLIVYLYQQGYRNFLFFVNSTNIIEKTRENFLNPASVKYLFAEQITLGNRRVQIADVQNFEAANPYDINICFTTIQKLHSDLTSQKENALTYEDFRKHKIVLLADEAHHINVSTKSQGALFESWENTVERIFQQNPDNLLLEFTATHDYATPAMVDKYRSKVIIRYDLLQFRNDRYSKDVVIVQSDFEQPARILQALLLSEYKQAVAAKHRINLKPVILFKAQRTIEQSKQVQAEFHALVNALTPAQIARIRTRTDIPLVQRAFTFFAQQKIGDDQLVERLQQGFQPDYCLSVNDEKEKDTYQILVNTLEDPRNRIRAIFAVQKLNEGWDVLNLFDIVRCYEARDTGRAKIGTTTLSEAQLIGRGARYFPFVLPAQKDRFRRKFDDDLAHELRVLEELHYHSVNDSRYISEIRQALVEQGMLDAREVTRELNLKPAFKTTDFYKTGIIWRNDRRAKDYKKVQSFADLGVTRRNYVHIVATGHGGTTTALQDDKKTIVRDETRLDVNVRDLERNLLWAALDRNPFYTFENLKKFFPNLNSRQTFLTDENYLGGLQITFQGNIYALQSNPAEKLAAVQGLLAQIEQEIRANVTEYEGTREFRRDWVREVFKDKTLKFNATNLRALPDEQFAAFAADKDWFATNTLYGTSEERGFVKMFDRFIGTLQARYEQIYLLRNENHFALYHFADGREFQPDFVLFLREKDGAAITYQVFIEPKGDHLADKDRWKEDFLAAITAQHAEKLLTFEDKHYHLIGAPFYHSGNENEFKTQFEGLLKV